MRFAPRRTSTNFASSRVGIDVWTFEDLIEKFADTKLHTRIHFSHYSMTNMTLCRPSMRGQNICFRSNVLPSATREWKSQKSRKWRCPANLLRLEFQDSRWHKKRKFKIEPYSKNKNPNVRLSKTTTPGHWTKTEPEFIAFFGAKIAADFMACSKLLCLRDEI